MQRVLIWDVPFLGAEFAILRTLVSLPLPILAGLIARNIPLTLTLRPIAGGAGAMATLLLAAPQAAALAGTLELPDTAGASLLADDLLLIRLLATDGFTLRRDLIPLIEALSSAPIPRVWRL